MAKTQTVVAEKAKPAKQVKAAEVKVPAKAAKVVEKAAEKVAAKPVEKVRAAPTGKTPFFVLAAIARPVSGGLLFAHTMAAMHVLGMFAPSRPTVPKDKLVGFIGPRAVKYHTVTKGTLELTEGGNVRVTPEGMAFFKYRQESGAVQKADFDGFVEIFTKGTAPKDFAVKASNIVPLAG